MSGALPTQAVGQRSKLGAIGPSPAEAACAARRRHGAVALLVLAAIAAVYSPTIASAFAGQDLGSLNVAVLAPLAAAWMAWMRRDRLRGLALRCWWPGLLLLAASALLWCVGELTDANVLRQGALVAMFASALAAIMGRSCAAALAVPLAFLLFAVNAYFPLIPALMQQVAWTGLALLRATGVPVHLENLAFVTPFGRWQVIEGCSGLDYVLIYAMSAAVFASLAFRSLRRKAAFVAGAVLAALLANGLRAWAIVFLAYLRDGADIDHAPIGWMVFAVVLLTLLAGGWRLSRDEPQEPAQAPAALGPASPRAALWAALAALGIAAAAPAAMAALDARAAGSFDGCRIATAANDAEDAASATTVACTGPAGRRLSPDVAENALRARMPGVPVVTGRRAMRDERGAPVEAATFTALGTRVPLRVSYWYDVDGTRESGRIGLKLRMIAARLEGRDPVVTVRMFFDRAEDEPRR